MKDNEIQDKARYLCEALIQQGFIVHKYTAYSTNSIYIKLDYGVCNSIRISDHNGKEHLSYRYNIGKDIKQCYSRDEPYKRYYFPFKMQGHMIDKILKDRQEKIDKYGILKYEEYVEINKEKSVNKKGFWDGCCLVNKD